MSEYSNQFSVHIAEMARLVFNDVKQDQSVINVAEIVVHIECLKAIADVINNTLKEHSDKIEQFKQNNQTNKALS